MPVKDAARSAAFEAISNERDAITRVCREIYADPEPPLAEHRAADRLVALLEGYGFQVERGIAGLPTAFHARYERHDPEFMRKGARHGEIGFIAEYDALPESGHVHGHHLVAGAAIATAVALKAALETGEHGTVNVIGCPGTFVAAKRALSKEGVFSPMDAVIGVHPASTGQGFLHTIDSSGNTLGAARVTVSFTAPNAPELIGRLVEAFDATPPDTRDEESVQVVDDAGLEAGVAFDVRAASRSRIVELLVDIKVLAQSVVEATGDGFEFDVSDIFDDMIVSRLIARRMKTYADNLGFRLDKIVKMPYGEPTEWGIVSYDTSTFQGFYPITTSDVELGEPAFAEASDTDEAYEQTFRVAECMSFAALDILRDVDFRAMIDNQLVKALHARGVERLHRRWTGLHRVLPGSDERGAKRGPALLDFKIVQGPDTEPTDEPST